jgi:hypothetical protein
MIFYLSLIAELTSLTIIYDFEVWLSSSSSAIYHFKDYVPPKQLVEAYLGSLYDFQEAGFFYHFSCYLVIPFNLIDLVSIRLLI